MLRLLFITKDTSIEDPESALYRRVTDMCGAFKEVHIILIKKIVRGEKKVLPDRLLNNVWRYTVRARTSMGSVLYGYETAVRHLVFGGSFRADVIVTDGAYEEGVLGWLLGRKFHRPFQLQIQHDFFDETLSAKRPSFLNRIVTEMLLSHTERICVTTEEERGMLVSLYDCSKENIEVLPSTSAFTFQDTREDACNLRARFPEYTSLLMYIPPEKNNEQSLGILHAFAKVLKKYPDLGLLVVQEGPERLLFERNVIALGIQRQVVFEVYSSRTASYMKNVDMLIHFSNDSEKEKMLAIAGMVHAPVIADVSGKGGALFRDLESAYLCTIDDTACVTKALDACLYNNGERARITENAHMAAQEYFKQDYNKYLKEYTKSINACSIADSIAE